MRRQLVGEIAFILLTAVITLRVIAWQSDRFTEQMERNAAYGWMLIEDATDTAEVR